MLASLPQQSIHTMALPSQYGPTAMTTTGQPISLPNQPFHPQAQVPGVLTQVPQGMVQGIPGQLQQRHASQPTHPNQPGQEGHGQPFAMQNGVMVARPGQMQKPDQMGMMPAGFVGMAGNFPQRRNQAGFPQQVPIPQDQMQQHLMQQRAAQQRQMVQNVVMMNNGSPMQGMETNGTGGMAGQAQRQQMNQMGQPAQQSQMAQQAQSATPQPSHFAQPTMGPTQRPPPTPGPSNAPNQGQGTQQNQAGQQGQGQGQQDGEKWDGEVM
jgi:hypothetical protein